MGHLVVISPDVKPVEPLMSRMRRPTFLAMLGCFSVGLWIVFARFVVPPIIVSAYRGDSLPLLNRLIEGQAELPVDFYLGLWNRIALEVGCVATAFWMLTALMTSAYFSRHVVGMATPGTLGAIRMWTCVILLMTTLWDDLGTIALLPAEYRAQMGLMEVFRSLPIGFDRFTASETSLTAFQRATEVLLLLGAVGWRTRVIIPLCALFTFIMNGILREYSGFWHQNLVPLYVLVVLSFTPCADGWSIDRLRRLFQGRPVAEATTPSLLYGWARYACWVPIALTYASAGFSKLRISGLDWISARNMKALLYEQTLYPRAGNLSISLHLVSAPDFVFVLLAVAAVCGEALFITVLFSRTCRRIMPAVGILMHIGIVFLQNIVFFDLTLLLLIFYDLTWIRERLGQWLRRAGPVEIFYTASCPSCCRSVRILRALDLFERLALKDPGRLPPDHLHVPGLALAPAPAMSVGTRGTTYHGADAYRVLARVLPPLWPIVPLTLIPGVFRLGQAIGRRIARDRGPLVTPEGPVPGSPLHAQRFATACGVALAAIIAIQTLFWLNRLEFYPFTSVQMFTGKPGTVVTYYKTLGHWESGRVSTLRLEDTIGVLALNSRYEALFELCFGNSAQSGLCQKTVLILGSAYNKKVAAGDKLTQLEIQRWKWDFGANPRDPNYGQMDTRFISEVLRDRPAGSGAGSDRR